MDKLPLDISLCQKDANNQLDFLEVLIKHYEIDLLLDVTLQITYDLSELNKDEIIPLEIVERINQVHDQVLAAMSEQYIEAKNKCNALQDEIKTDYARLKPELPLSYVPPYIFDLDLVIDIFYHYEYLQNYKKDLQMYEVLINLRKQHLSEKPKSNNKTNTVSITSKELH